MKVILKCDYEDLLLALRAAEFLHKHPDRNDAIVGYGQRHFYVKVNPNSGTISVQAADHAHPVT